MRAPVRLGLAGAGLVGPRHASAIAAASGALLGAVADPRLEAAQALGAQHGALALASTEALAARADIDALILATPNQHHAEGALAAIAAGKPVLVEKPLAARLEDGERVVAAAKRAGVPLAVGHHRRHNPIIAKAKALIEDGCLGRIVSVCASAVLAKPQDYFAPPWRRAVGAGPVAVNLIHDIDLMRHLCGPVTEVAAMDSRAVRGFDVEDTAVAVLRFASGALGTLTVSDTAVAPWSWELTARENPAYPATPESCYQICGTEGALALPNLALWRHADRPSWWEPIGATRFPVPFEDPLVRQIEQFAAVVRGEAAPLVSGEDGLATLALVEAVQRAAASGERVRVHGDG